MNILRDQVNAEFEKKKEKYGKKDPFYDSLIEMLQQKRDEDLEAIDGSENRNRKRTYTNSKKVDLLEK